MTERQRTYILLHRYDTLRIRLPYRTGPEPKSSAHVVELSASQCITRATEDNHDQLITSCQQIPSSVKRGRLQEDMHTANYAIICANPTN
jgi:hypothetical protein